MAPLAYAAYLSALERLIRPIAADALPGTLAPMAALMQRLGNPQRRVRVVVVAGSTGKTTTAHALAHAYAAQGHSRVGLYTSPHLHHFTERMIMLEDGAAQPISHAAFADHAEAVLAAAGDSRYSTFELATAVAYRWFASENVSMAVMEIGIGGRFDAVNIVSHGGGAAALAVITPIEVEHAAMLGGTLERIAWHKAGVLPVQGTALVVAPQDETVMRVLREEAQARGTLLHPAEPFSHPVIGRFEQVPGPAALFIDGGHTPASLARSVAGLREAARPLDTARPPLVVLGILRDKPPGGLADALAQPAAGDAGMRIEVICTTPPSTRALAGEVLADAVRARTGADAPVLALDAALARAHAEAQSGRAVLVAGSLRMASAAREAFGLLSADALREAADTRALFEQAGRAFRSG